MMLRPDGLADALARAKGALPAVVWIASDEPLLRLEAADTVRTAARSVGFDERRVFQADRGFRPALLMQEAGALSLFASRRLLELRIDGKVGRELGQGLADAVSSMPEDTRLMVTSPRLDRSATEAAWYGRIVSSGWMLALPAVERERLPAWIGERLARQGQRADAATLQLIADRVEGNLLAAHQEVAKLALLCPSGRLEVETVRAAVLDVARWDVFDLVGAALTAETARALRCLAGLRAEGTAVPVVLWALADAVRTLLRVAQARAGGRPIAQALRDARVWGPRERAFTVALGRLDPPGLRLLLRACARTDRITKGVLEGDAWQSVEAIVLGLAGVNPLALRADAALAH